MKKTLLLFMLFIPLLGFTQTFNKDSVVVHFKQILNEYRVDYGLPELEIDNTLKPFAEAHSRYMKENKEVTHGEGRYDFSKRFEDYFGEDIYGGENCGGIVIPNANPASKIVCEIAEINPILRKILDGKATDYDFALYVFLLWKNSDAHNRFMLSQNTKSFYLSYDNDKTYYYVEYVAWEN